MRLCRAVSAGAFALYAAAACGDGQPDAEPDYSTWITQPEFEFNSDPDRDVRLSQVPYLRVDPVRNRVFVIDLLDVPVTAWTPEGSVVFSAGRGQGPGEFIYPARIYFDDDGGFVVGEHLGTRFTSYTLDGELVSTVPGTPTSVTYDGFMLNLEAPVSDGGFLGYPQIPIATALGMRDRPPINAYPLLRVHPAERGRWSAPQPVFWLNIQNRTAAVQRGERTIFAGQPFGDQDLWRVHPGGAVVARRNGTAGVVDLIELNARGDTLWERSLFLQPRLLTAERVETTVESWVASRARSLQESPVTLRRAYESALYRPEHLPAVDGIVLTASGEVWMETLEHVDTLRVFYALRRGDMAGQPRRILLPDGVWVQDATRTHVWGIRRDEYDMPWIVGRRLVPLTG